VQDRVARRASRRRARRRRRLASVVVTAFCALWLVVLTGFSADATRTTPHIERPPRTPEPRQARPSTRPPQFVVVSFDGGGGDRLWTYWRPIARRTGAHFTFFVSGVYLLDEARRELYRPPRHPRGASDIGFAQPDGERSAAEVVRATLRQIAAAHREGHEIGTHFNGHFCAGFPGSVGEWTAADWNRELDEFERLLFEAPARLPLRAADVVGARTPCLEGNMGALYPVLAARGFRYDSSQVARLGDWPWRERGLWSVPLLELPLAGHDFRVISMDYNFMVNQTGLAPPAVELETYRTLRNAFDVSYRGNRAPLTIGSHFQTWNHWAYNRAIARLVREVCELPEVRCASARELVDWLDLNRR
jgi:peptidoglycan/xylan/chitin deacetylase (PgdA/CDA1 family)